MRQWIEAETDADAETRAAARGRAVPGREGAAAAAAAAAAAYGLPPPLALCTRRPALGAAAGMAVVVAAGYST